MQVVLSTKDQSANKRWFMGHVKSERGEFRGNVGVNGGNVGHGGKNGEYKGQKRD